ncbi:MAG: DNA internalization-related competence protein ComEC/Rec2 [Elusimicrobiota bacterium]
MRDAKLKFLVILFTGLLVVNLYSQQETKPKNLEVYFLDVGQGDGAFLKTPNGKNILIDAGQCALEDDEFDAGKEIVIPFLVKQGITKIDCIVASHAHADHIGGLISIMKKYPVGEVLDTGFPYPSPVYTRFLQVIKLKKIKYKIVTRGEILHWDADLSVEVLSPNTNQLFDDPNNNSIVLKITYKNVSFLFTGDMETSAEESVLSNYKKSELSAVILKVAHHGSRSSSTEDFLSAVSPEVAVMSVGRYNRFRLPHPTIVKRYNDFDIELHRTDKEGTIIVTTDGETYSLNAVGFSNR